LTETWEWATFPPVRERSLARIFLLVAAVTVGYFVFRIFQPFLQAIALAIIFATLCHPLYQLFLTWLRGRESAASLLTCTVVVLLIVIPFLGLLTALAVEIGRIYDLIQEQRNSGVLQEILELQKLPFLNRLQEWLGPYVDLERINLLEGGWGLLQQLSVYLIRYSTAVLGSLAGLVGQFILIVVTMFFLLRDGDRLVRHMDSLTPFSRRYEELLVSKFREVTRATVLGTLVTALAQGTAGGLLFLSLGIHNVVFWGALIGLFSMVPVVGTALVWVPWAIYFVATGSYLKAAVLVALAVTVVASLDNIVRPLFIEGRAGMHTLVVFFSLMGGVAYFGVVGLIFGPILVSLALTLLEVYRLEFQDELQKRE